MNRTRQTQQTQQTPYTMQTETLYLILNIFGLIAFDVAAILWMIYKFVDWRQEFYYGYHPGS